MSVLWSAFDLLWKLTEKADNANHATQTEPAGVTQICDIPYIYDGDRLHKLDVYYPSNGCSFPVIIDIHGGGWMYGDKELNKFYNLELAARGFTVYSISYRLVPDVAVKDQIKECMLALKKINEIINSYPWDGKNIMLTGDSAGGQLSAYAACLLESAELRSVFDTVDAGMHLTALTLTSPVAYMDCGFPTGIYTKMMWGADYKSAPTCEFMNLDSLLPYTKLPPTLIITSSGDFLAEHQSARACADLKKRGFRCKLVDYPSFEGKKLPHVFAVQKPCSDAGKSCLKLMTDFYKRFTR